MLIVLWIVFAPEIPPYETKLRAKMLFGNDDITLDMNRDPVTGTFVDERMQLVYDAGVIAELIQAVGRARLNRSPRTVVILSSHNLPGITDRKETYLFDETDFEVANGLEDLAKVVKQREKDEIERDNNISTLKTITDFQIAYNVSNRQARRLWELEGGKEKLIQEVFRLKSNKVSNREIAKSFNITIVWTVSSC